MIEKMAQVLDTPLRGVYGRCGAPVFHRHCERPKQSISRPKEESRWVERSDNHRSRRYDGYRFAHPSYALASYNTSGCPPAIYTPALIVPPESPGKIPQRVRAGAAEPSE